MGAIATLLARLLPAQRAIFTSQLTGGQQVVRAGTSGRLFSVARQNSRVQGFIRNVATTLGIASLGEFFIPDDLLPTPSGGIGDLIPFTGMSGPPEAPHPASVVRSWNTMPANPALGVWFVELANGQYGAMKKNGSWSYWRPRKNVPVTSSGANSIQNFVKADRYLNRQAKKIQRALNRRAPATRRRRSETRVVSSSRPVVIESGEGSVVTGG